MILCMVSAVGVPPLFIQFLTEKYVTPSLCATSDSPPFSFTHAFNVIDNGFPLEKYYKNYSQLLFDRMKTNLLVVVTLNR